MSGQASTFAILVEGSASLSDMTEEPMKFKRTNLGSEIFVRRQMLKASNPNSHKDGKAGPGKCTKHHQTLGSLWLRPIQSSMDFVAHVALPVQTKLDKKSCFFQSFAMQQRDRRASRQTANVQSLGGQTGPRNQRLLLAQSTRQYGLEDCQALGYFLLSSISWMV